jgi:hypothetical protein
MASAWAIIRTASTLRRERPGCAPHGRGGIGLLVIIPCAAPLGQPQRFNPCCQSPLLQRHPSQSAASGEPRGDRVQRASFSMLPGCRLMGREVSDTFRLSARPRIPLFVKVCLAAPRSSAWAALPRRRAAQRGSRLLNPWRLAGEGGGRHVCGRRRAISVTSHECLAAPMRPCTPKELPAAPARGRHFHRPCAAQAPAPLPPMCSAEAPSFVP